MAPPIRWMRLAERDAGHRAAGLGQAADARPLVAVEGETLVVRRAVLFDEAAEGIQAFAERGHADMVGAARQLRQFFPLVGCGVVGMVVGLVDALLGIAADQMHAVAIGHRPGHLGARNRQRRAWPPVALHGGARRRAVGHRLLRVHLGQVDATRLVQPLELALLMVVRLRACQRRYGNRRRGGEQVSEEAAAGQGHGVDSSQMSRR